MTGPQVHLLAPMEIFVCRTGSVVHGKVHAGVLIGAFHESSKVGGVVLVSTPSEQVIRSMIEELARRIGASGAPQREIRFKILSVGATDYSAISGKLLQELGFSLVGTAFEESAVDAYFYCDRGRLRLAPLEAPKVEPVIPNKGASRGRTRVLIVDDSKTIRQLLTRILSADPEIEVIGAAECPSQADRMIRELRPDVITLDIHMPEMDGVTFLQRYIQEFPIPTIMISSISMEEGSHVLHALEIGAVDYIQKPSFEELDRLAPYIVEKVRIAANVKVRRSAGVRESHARLAEQTGLNRSIIVAVGASTGGTEALRAFLSQLPKSIPPIVIVQHIPPVFSKAFATRLDATCPFEVKEAENGDSVQPDRVLIAPGGLQMAVEKGGPSGYRVKVWDGEPVNRHKPSVDVLFRSVSEHVGKKSIGIIMTGMGRDGAAGMLAMKKTGSRTIAQDEASCVVFGMPKEAIKLGGAERIVPLNRIAETLVTLLS